MILQRAMADIKNRCPGCKRTHCGGCGIYRKLNTNKQARIQFPPDFKPEQGTGLGISFDVGTTTLAGMLWDLGSGTLLDAETGANPQAVFGADVASRVLAAQKEPGAGRGGKLKRMQKMLADALDEMASRMIMRLADAEETDDIRIEENDKKIEENEIENRRKNNAQLALGGVRKVTVVGNTAMCEIFLGTEPVGLLKAPFTPDYGNARQGKGKEFGFAFLQDADVTVLPPIGGYVGADALAVYHYISCCEKEKKILAVDIGTNGEILLQRENKKFACSAAAGPALEGGAVSFGMRAVQGAVDMVFLNGRFPMEDIVCRVIGGVSPSGICGSGLVDALSLLLQAKVVDHTGYMRSAGEAKAAGAPLRMIRRIKEGGERRFLLTDESHPVYLTAGDIRQLQLSIGAIRAGMEALLKKAGLQACELDRIYLAGAFGCYIGIESGIRVGLFPSVPAEKILQAGNLAGIGAAMALLSLRELWEMEKESREIVHVELAEDEAFKELFLCHMNFVL